MLDKQTKTVDTWLNEIDYTNNVDYVPSEFALEFVNFIKLLTKDNPTENKTPVIHYKMLDNIAGKKEDIANMCFRGSSKTTLLGEYLFLYIAVYGGIPGFGNIDYALYISDSIENGVKKMRLRLERQCQTSSFLAKYLTSYKFTDIRWYFKNAQGKEFVVTGHGSTTGVRGTAELGTRPQLAVLDDLVSDEDAKSATIIANIEDTVYKAINYALHPNKRKIIWSGTPFNAKDPLYKAVESGAWYVNVYPVCEKFPCDRKDFRGAWEERFNYDYIKTQYEKALRTGKLDSFNQELMLRIMSEEDRLVKDTDIIWYSRNTLLKNRGLYNYYITTDFATSDKQHADYSVIAVWALNSKGDWYLVDLFCKRCLMDESIDNLFRLAQIWKPQEVGIEVTGQQGAFISWVQNEMLNRNIFFSLSKGKTAEGRPGKTFGIRPYKDKMSRFQQNALPLFLAKKIWLPEELKNTEEIVELLYELCLITYKGFKSKHDDILDTISMLAELNVWQPSEGIDSMEFEEKTLADSLDIWEDKALGYNKNSNNSYFV